MNAGEGRALLKQFADVGRQLTPPLARASTSQRLSSAFAFSAALLCFVILLQWIFAFGDEASLRRVSGMVPSTAILMILVACGLILSKYSNNGLSNRARWLAVGLVLAGALIDQELLFLGGGTGLDRLLIPGFSSSVSSRMSTMTALCLILSSTALALVNTERRRQSQIFVVTASLGLLLSGIGLIGHLFDSESLYRVFVFRAMSLPTSFGFLLLFLAFLISRPDIGWVSIIAGEGPGSRSARRLSLVMLGAPLALTYAGFTVEKYGGIDINFLLSMLAILMSFVLFSGLLLLADRDNAGSQQQSVLIASLERTVADRDLLLSEVYHRVKNNLQQINALLFIQAQSSDHDGTKDALMRMSGRIESLGVVQRLLLEAPARNRLDIATFLTELGERLEAALSGTPSDFKISHDLEPQEVELDAAITLGLIVNELVANSAKYAFGASSPGSSVSNVISIRLIHEDDDTILLVEDNGVGLPHDQEEAMPTGGAGSTIVRALTQQLKGRLEIRSEHGLCTSIRFPNDVLRGQSA